MPSPPSTTSDPDELHHPRLFSYHELHALVLSAVQEATNRNTVLAHDRHSQLLSRLNQLDTVLQHILFTLSTHLNELQTELHTRLRTLERHSRYVDENGDPLPILWRRPPSYRLPF